MQVNMLDAKSKLSSLVAAALQGEEVILARDGVPVAKIVKYDRPKVRAPGAWRGLVPVSADWNTPATNAEVERLFYRDDAAPTSKPTSQIVRHRTRRKAAKKR
jgi:antitoxin (DNA-binding transcriptional repressor) of toxin-antitoxin stability system